MNKIKILKIIDVLAGKPLLWLLSFIKKQKDDPVQQPQRVLFIRPGGIGDAVLLIPAIAALKYHYPDAVIDILAEKRNAAVFSLSFGIRSIFLYDKPSDLLSVLRLKYDVVIDSEQWHRLSAVMARLTTSSSLIGFGTNERRAIFTRSVCYSHNDHETDSFLHLVTPIMQKSLGDIMQPFLSIPATVSENIQPCLRALSGMKIISLFPGGSIREKRWSVENFCNLARLIVKRGFGIVVIGGIEDKATANEITGSLPSAINVCGTLSLVESAAVINKTDLLISGDSGIMHIASGLGIKVLALFGPSNAKKWAPQSNHSIVLTRNLDCSPCSKFGYTPRCKRHLECMKQISVNEVFEAAVKLLEI